LLSRPRAVIAIALMFWCAGAGCMMVSYARGVMSDENSSMPAAEHSMSMLAAMDAHACCKDSHRSLTPKHQAAKRALDINLREFTLPSPAPAGVMSCCPLTSGSIVVASRTQTNDSAYELADTESASFKLENSHQTTVAAPQRLPNRARSYLLDCAFLI